MEMTNINMAALRSIGMLLQCSGWIGVLVESKIASSSSAEFYLSASVVPHMHMLHRIIGSGQQRTYRTVPHRLLIHKHISASRTGVTTKSNKPSVSFLV